MTSNPGATPLQTTAQAMLGIAILLCGTELVPGWGMLGLGWPPEAHYAIMAAAGAFAGAVTVRRRYAVPGLIAGAVAGIGALAAVAWYLTFVERTPTELLVVVGAVGALPGIGLYYVLRWVQDGIWPAASGFEPLAASLAPSWPERQGE
jgi:hypothetical protein